MQNETPAPAEATCCWCQQSGPVLGKPVVHVETSRDGVTLWAHRECEERAWDEAHRAE